jgi:hypothetical protein
MKVMADSNEPLVVLADFDFACCRWLKWKENTIDC